MQTTAAIPESLQGKCLTCLGTGEAGSIHGAVGCADCDGSGRPPRRHVLTERRLREIETRFRNDETQAGIDVTWLVFELRRSREALMKVLTMSGEAGGPGETSVDVAASHQVWHIANNVLMVYEPESLRPKDDSGR